MSVNYSISDEIDYFYLDNGEIEKYYQIINSDLSMFRIWNSLLEDKKLTIKVRAGYIFYSDCPFHRAKDYPVCIDEQRKGFFCYGCGKGGTVITLVAEYFGIKLEESLNILYSYITNNTKVLNPKQTEILNKIFSNYNSKEVDKYFSQSKEKTNYLNQRIDRYIEKNGYSVDNIKKMKKRLCCTTSHIKKQLKERNNESYR